MRIEQIWPTSTFNYSQWFVNCAYVDIVGPGGGVPTGFARFPGTYDISDPGKQAHSQFPQDTTTSSTSTAWTDTLTCLCCTRHLGDKCPGDLLRPSTRGDEAAGLPAPRTSGLDWLERACELSPSVHSWAGGIIGSSVVRLRCGLLVLVYLVQVVGVFVLRTESARMASHLT